jgi:hypothetical protein
VNLVRGNTILAIGKHPESTHPLIQPDGAVFHDGANLDAELPLRVLSFALPDMAARHEPHIGASASRTEHYSIRPTLNCHVVDTGVLIAEVLNCFLKCLWLSHGFLLITTWKQNSSKRLLSQVYYYPS